MTTQRRWRVLAWGGAVLGIYLILSQPILGWLRDWQQRSVPNDVRLSRSLYAELSGGRRPRKTLLVFVNNAEQRTGGGFVGTVGLLEGENGKVRLTNVRSVYYYDHRIEQKSSFISPPNYLRTLTPFIAARDSLISPDPQENATIFRDLFARESGIYADNVVQVTPKILQLLLSYTGPIKLDEYGLTVTADTITTDLQKEVESGIDKQNGRDPKTILSVLAGRLASELPSLRPNQLLALQKDIIGLLVARQLYITAASPTLTQQLAAYQHSLATPGESHALLMTAANYNATKSSQAIRQTSNVELSVSDDGTQLLQIEISRQHTRDYEGAYVDPRTGLSGWLIGDDVSWISLYLPSGTRLIKGDGFDMSNEGGVRLGKSVATRPKTTSTIQVTVQLPEKVVLSDNLQLQQILLSQFGWWGQDYRVTLRAPEGYRVVNAQGGEVLADGRSVRYTGYQINDKVFESVFTKRGS